MRKLLITVFVCGCGPDLMPVVEGSSGFVVAESSESDDGATSTSGGESTGGSSEGSTGSTGTGESTSDSDCGTLWLSEAECFEACRMSCESDPLGVWHCDAC